MAQLAIEGHATRGKEVIEILEMLGGKISDEQLYGNGTHYGYYIQGNGHISLQHCSLLNNAIVFTLEEFLEKFPYKVGDKVVYENKKREITKMVWEERTNTVAYKLDDKLYCNVIDELQPYKEEIIDGKYNVEKYLKVWDETEKGLEVVVNDNFELKEDNGKFYIVKKQPQYPKTYEECCEVLGISPSFGLLHDGNRVILAYGIRELAYLQELLICRDAYWKIAGDEMGLGKPWEPDWAMYSDLKHCIIYSDNEIKWRCKSFVTEAKILAFPTEETRDAFFENFKELIKECISLL